jgi:hypothetical protein
MWSCYHLPRRDTRSLEVRLPDHIQTVSSGGVRLNGREDSCAIRTTDPLSRAELPHERGDNYSLMQDFAKSGMNMEIERGTGVPQDRRAFTIYNTYHTTLVCWVKNLVGPNIWLASLESLVVIGTTRTCQYPAPSWLLDISDYQANC